MMNSKVFIVLIIIAFEVATANVTESSLGFDPDEFSKLIPRRTTSINCSTDEGGLLNFPDDYKWRTCAVCYSLIPPYMFKSKESRLEHRNGFLWKTDILNGTKRYLKAYLPNHENPFGPIYKTFKGKKGAYNWMECCEAAFDCCVKMVQDGKKNDEKMCKRTWDGWHCIDDTPAGQTFQMECPKYIYFATDEPPCTKMAKRQCTLDGQWQQGVDGKLFTDYIPCGPAQDLLERIYVHCGSYSLSIVALIPAIAIMLCHRQLQSPRIRIHKHFFISLLMNSIAVITFKSVLATHIADSSSSLISENGVGCKILFSLTRYFRMTNYMWMFCEGYYLHKLIVSAFAEQNSLLPLYIIGWGCPMFAVSIYSIIRAIYFDTQCWAKPAADFEWIINGPNLFCLAINLAFLCNIIRVLWSKLRARYVNEPSHFRKTAKATLVLIPLFGVHFLLVLYRPQDKGDCLATKFHFFIYYIIDGIQGFLVACIYCYMNSEVQTTLKRSYARFRQSWADKKSNRRLMSSRTQSFSTNVSSSVENQLHHNKNWMVKNGKRSELEMTVIQEEKIAT